MPKKKKAEPESRVPKEIIKDLAPAYLDWKSNEKDKNKYKDEFFDAITRELGKGDLAEEIITGVEAKDEEQALELVAKQYPTWTTEDVREDPENDGLYEVIIKENPEYLPFTIEFGKKVWGRQVASGSQMLDDERLKDEDEDLWYEVTEFPNEDFILALVYETGYEPEQTEYLISAMADKFGISRQLKSLSDIDAELQPKLQKYIYEGKPVVKFPAPKKAESSD